MQTARDIAIAAVTFLPAAVWALTDTGAPTWILWAAGALVVLGGCGLLCWACCAVSGRCAQREEDTLGVRRS